MSTLAALLTAATRTALLPEQRARIGYAILAKDATSVTGASVAARALVQLGDLQGAKEILTKVAAAVGTRNQRELAQIWLDIKALEPRASQPSLTLNDLRAEGRAGVARTVSAITLRSTGRKIPCPKCNGNGDIHEYVHIADGKCFRCGGRRTITDRKTEW